MFGAVATWFLARAWRSSYVFRRPEVAVALAGAAMLSGWLWWVSRPARELNVAVEDFESWVTAGYLVPVSLPVPVACAAIIVALVMHGVERRSWRTWLWVSAGLVAAGFQLVDHLSRAISGFLLSLGRHSWLTDLRTQGVDQLFLPAVAALALCTIPGIVSELRSVGHRRDARAAATDLELLWREITAAVPGVSKPETGTLPIEERVAEMLIEIEDGLIRLNLSLASTSAEEAARDLIALLAAPALESSTVPSSVRVPDWVADQSKIRLVAREYRAMTSASHVSI
ncbi:DUF6545 domain-containing protein [Rhodococcus rhodnii]|uniref:DUF6545 domain-containing protein n=1 Tax=Rhodococcus rhodnii TaxID=38312 RepID=UPI001160AD54|nr:DUF6545 domain-containing protein [Rhodococcus rhodnii]